MQRSPDISELAGPAWVTPVYNRAGNMTTIPKPADPTQSFTGTYDAWNRLVKLEDGSGTVAQYENDAAKRRTVKKTYTSGTLSETRHFYYTEPSRWQIVEERVESNSTANRHYVWGRRYIDDTILRDRDAAGTCTFDERLYSLSNAGRDICTLVSNNGTPCERFAYTAYGSTTYLSREFLPTSTSAHDWSLTFAGYYLDFESGLKTARNRRYHSRFGTWLSRDPLMVPVPHNLYEYVQSRPLSFSDPLGLFECPFYTSEGLGCICGMVSLNDIFVGVAALLVPHPWLVYLSKVFNTLSCICAGASIIAQACLCKTRRFNFWDGVFFWGNAVGCIDDILQLLLRPEGSAMQISLFFEIIAYIAAYVAADEMGGTSNPLRACCNTCTDHPNWVAIGTSVAGKPGSLAGLGCQLLSILKEKGRFECPTFRLL